MTLGQCLSQKFGKDADSDEILKVNVFVYCLCLNIDINAELLFVLLHVELDFIM